MSRTLSFRKNVTSGSEAPAGTITTTSAGTITSTFVIAPTGVTPTIQYVGGLVGNNASAGADYTLDLTTLTGGIATAPAEGDLVIVSYGEMASSDYDMSVCLVTTGYTMVADLFQSETYDASMGVAYKLMGSTPDTTLEISPNQSRGATAVVHVWRGVDQTLPIGVSASATSANSSTPNPPSITPVHAESVIIATGQISSANTMTLDTPPAGYSNVLEVSKDITYASTSVIASKYWGSGAEDPGVFDMSANASTDSWGVVTLSINPEGIYDGYASVRSEQTADTSGTTATSITLNKPSDIEVGDLLILVVGTDSKVTRPGSSQTPSGWTHLQDMGGGNPDCSVAAYYRVADGTEGASETVSLNGNWDAWGNYLAMKDVDTSVTIATSSSTFTGSSTSLAIPSVTTTEDKSLIMIVTSYDGADYGTYSFTEAIKHGQYNSGTTSSAGAGGAIGFYYAPTAGATGTMGNAQVTSADGMVLFSFALAPQTSVAHTKDLEVTAQATATAPGVTSLLRTITATAQVGASFIRQVAREISTTAQATASFIRQLGRELSVTAQATATLQAGLLYVKDLVTTAQASLELTKQQVTLKSLTATAQATASIDRLFAYGKELTATAQANPSIDKGLVLSQILTATAQATGQVVKSGLILSRTLVVVASATVTRTVVQSLSRILTVTGRAVTSILKDYGYIDKYPENDTSYEDKYPPTS